MKRRINTPGAAKQKEPKCVRKAKNIIRDARHCYNTFYLPFLFPIFIFRLFQFYSLKPELDALRLPKDFRETYAWAGRRLWVAALMWPVIIVVSLIVLIIVAATAV